MLEKLCAVVKSQFLYIYWENDVTQPKILCQVLKKEIKWKCLISEFWKKKKYSEENIVLIHWQILQLLILAVPVQQASQTDNFIKIDKLIVFFFYVTYYIQFC